MLTPHSPILAPVAKKLPPRAMATFVDAANDVLETGSTYNDAVVAGWNAVKMEWEAPPEGKRWIKKAEPTAGDVHVDVPMGAMKPKGDQGKKKKNGKDVFNVDAIDDDEDDDEGDETMANGLLKIVKADDEQRIAYGWASVIAIKGQPFEDSQGDIIDDVTLEKAVADFMFDVRRSLAMHQRNADNKIDPSMVKGTVIHSMPLTKDIKKALGIESDMEGWIVGVKVFDDDVWKRVKSGELASFSIGGRGYRTPVQKYNPNHAPAGSPEGGRFTSGDGGGGDEGGESDAVESGKGNFGVHYASRKHRGNRIEWYETQHERDFAHSVMRTGGHPSARKVQREDVSDFERPTQARGKEGRLYRHETSGKENVYVGSPPTREWKPVGKVLGGTVKDYIDDFLASDAPQFRGKSREERIQMALGAWYGGKSIDFNEIGQAYGENAISVIKAILGEAE